MKNEEIKSYLEQLIKELDNDNYEISLQVIPSINQIKYANGKKKQFIKYTRIIEIEDKEEKEI
jgi:hypothetical protein